MVLATRKWPSLRQLKRTSSRSAGRRCVLLTDHRTTREALTDARYHYTRSSDGLATARRQVSRTALLPSKRTRSRSRTFADSRLTDDSLGEPTNTTDATSDNGSSFGNGRRWGRKSGGGSKNGADGRDGDNEKDTIDEVDEIVVEATGSPGSWKAAAGNTGGSNREGASGTSPGTAMQGTAMQSEGSSLRATAYDNASGIIGTAGNFCRYRIWPLIVNFFEPRYHDASVEEGYQKELWYTHKSLCIFGACFLVFSWTMGVALLPRPWSLFNGSSSAPPPSALSYC